MRKYIILLIIVGFIFYGCGKKEQLTDHQHEHQGQSEEEQNHTHAGEAPEEDEHEHEELHLTPEKQKEWGIETRRASEINTSLMISLPGVLALNKNKTAYISSFAKGKVSSLRADLGLTVRRGQVLLVINSPEFAQAQAAFLQARANFNLSRKEFERAKMLLKEKAIEQKEYLRREAEHEKSLTDLGVKESYLHSFGLNHDQIDKLIEESESLNPDEYHSEVAKPDLAILSPINGKIIFRDAVVGDHIEPEKILFTVSDLSILWVLLDAYEKDLPLIHKKSTVTIKSSLYPDRVFPGKITYISDTIDEKLRTAKIRVEVRNYDYLLKPNTYIQGIIENKDTTLKFLAVPEEAIQNMNGEKVVFVVEEENVFAVREVLLGEKIGKNRIIAKGLSEKEMVVIKGAFNLKAEIAKESFGEAHVH
jgi:cobalt-zinc-cadmium efflux system membrane fusion protein